jgi:hypothetical protein
MSNTVTGGRTLIGGVLADARARLPFWDSRLEVFIESGWYRFSGSGERGLATDPDFGRYGYEWSMNGIPVQLGGNIRLGDLWRFSIAGGGGFSSVFFITQSTYHAGGEVTENAPHGGIAIGYFLDAEGTVLLGPGRLTVGIRYTDARTDLGYREIYGGVYNPDLGQVKGTSLLAGYRLDIIDVY